MYEISKSSKEILSIRQNDGKAGIF